MTTKKIRQQQPAIPHLTPPSPLLLRYLEVKRQNPGSILLFRMGDFYEAFFEDACVISGLLGLTMTDRGKGTPNHTPMAGFPYHHLDGYLKKLIACGQRVAVCEQVKEQP